MEMEGMKNAHRFSGFADVYDHARPAMPKYPVKIIQAYLQKPPQTVVDLGCGTGLSSLIWEGECNQVIGIEPNDTMRAQAEKKAAPWLSFQKAYSHRTGLPDEFCDAVVCSQSFHWMEPVATLGEVNRILTAGGVFATVDCDWPPVYHWEAENAYQALFSQVAQLEETIPALGQSFQRWSKSNHLHNMNASGYFRYTREVVFANTEPCTADRLIQMALSQGGLQGVLRYDPGLVQEKLAAFTQLVQHIYKDTTFPIDFCYRCRIGVK